MFVGLGDAGRASTETLAARYRSSADRAGRWTAAATTTSWPSASAAPSAPARDARLDRCCSCIQGRPCPARAVSRRDQPVAGRCRSAGGRSPHQHINSAAAADARHARTAASTLARQACSTGSPSWPWQPQVRHHEHRHPDAANRHVSLRRRAAPPHLLLPGGRQARDAETHVKRESACRSKAATPCLGRNFPTGGRRLSAPVLFPPRHGQDLVPPLQRKRRRARRPEP